MHRIIFCGVLALCASGGFAQSTSDCRRLGTATHCFSPPPSKPLTAEQGKALEAAIIAEDRAILAPLAAGASASTCEAIRRSAAQKSRHDLIQLVARQCSASSSTFSTLQ